MAKSFHGNFANKGKYRKINSTFKREVSYVLRRAILLKISFETQTFGIFKVFQSLEVSETCYFSVQNAIFKLRALENASYSHMNIKS